MYTAGTFDLLLNTLVKPHEAKRCVRPVDTSFVKALAARFEEDPSSPGIPPIAALCVSVPSKEAFDTKRKDGYRYEVLGGQHSALARKENPENMALQRVLAEVYIGLTDDESLHLASRHNVNGHFVHKMTHRDYVSYFMRYTNYNIILAMTRLKHVVSNSLHWLAQSPAGKPQKPSHTQSGGTYASIAYYHR